jgi:hypothetical protein
MKIQRSAIGFVEADRRSPEDDFWGDESAWIAPDRSAGR